MGDERRPGSSRGEPASVPPRRRGLFERLMFSFMGPPQVGDVNAPVTVPPDPAAALCHKCGQPWDEHEVVRTSSMTYAKCPAAPDAQPG